MSLSPMPLKIIEPLPPRLLNQQPDHHRPTKIGPLSPIMNDFFMPGLWLFAGCFCVFYVVLGIITIMEVHEALEYMGSRKDADSISWWLVAYGITLYSVGAYAISQIVVPMSINRIVRVYRWCFSGKTQEQQQNEKKG